jgi:hypothetical protein
MSCGEEHSRRQVTERKYTVTLVLSLRLHLGRIGLYEIAKIGPPLLTSWKTSHVESDHKGQSTRTGWEQFMYFPSLGLRWRAEEKSVPAPRDGGFLVPIPIHCAFIFGLPASDCSSSVSDFLSVVILISREQVGVMERFCIAMTLSRH